MDFSTQYQSDSNDSENGNSESSKIQSRRAKRVRQWKFEQRFSSKDEAFSYVKNKKIWSYLYRNKTKDGRKIYYRCNKVKRRGEQCNAGLYLLFESFSLDVILYRTEDGHTCHTLDQDRHSHRLSEDVKKEIMNMVELKVSPKRMMHQLREKNLPIRNKAQLDNFLHRLRVEKYGFSTISIGEIKQWCKNYSNYPDDIDQAYVFAHEFENSEEENDNGEKSFGVLISTPRMLSNASNISHIHVDATYKLNWEAKPVMIVGTTDMDRSFHPICICICSDERKASFQFIFRALYNHDATIRPKYLISDASNAIREAFVEVFGQESVLGMCWSHVRRNIEKKLSLLVEVERDQMISDIEHLQISPNHQIFEKAKQLFIKKYTKKEKAFIEYMKDMWLSTHELWHEGVGNQTRCLPSTNNALESFNLVVKKEETLRERIPFARFLFQCLESASRWSKRYINEQQIATMPTIKLSDWTSAYQWAKSEKLVPLKQRDNFVEYYCPSGELKSVTEDDIKRVLERQWNTFEQFLKRAFSMWIVRFPNNEDANRWQNAQCTCPHFLKQYKCKHTIGIAIRLKLTKPPPVVKMVPVEQKRKRGRPRKSTNEMN